MKLALFTVTYSGCSTPATHFRSRSRSTRLARLDSMGWRSRPNARRLSDRPAEPTARGSSCSGRPGHHVAPSRACLTLPAGHGRTREQPGHDASILEMASDLASIWSRFRGMAGALRRRRGGRHAPPTSGRRRTQASVSVPISGAGSARFRGFRSGWAADMGITLALQNHAPVTTRIRRRARDAGGNRSSERETLSRRPALLRASKRRYEQGRRGL